MTNYEKMAKDFLKGTNTKIKVCFKGVKTDKEIGWDGTSFNNNLYHNEYKVTLSRNGKSYTFSFYDSYKNYLDNERPTTYDILACLQKYEVEEDTWDFASEFGYEIFDRESYKRVEKIKNKCITQYNKLLRLFDNDYDIMDKLSEIC